MDVGETEVRRGGAPEAPGETHAEMRGDGETPEKPGETTAVRRAAGAER